MMRFIYRISRVFSESTMKRFNLTTVGLILGTLDLSDFKIFFLKHVISRQDILLAS